MPSCPPNDSSIIMMSTRVFFDFVPDSMRQRRSLTHLVRTWRGKNRRRALALIRAWELAETPLNIFKRGKS